MRIFGFLTAAVIGTFACTGAVSAADLPARVYTKAPIATVYNWTGFYVGGSLGGRWADVDGTTLSWGGGPPPIPALAQASYDSSTFRGGGYAGYNWQVSPNWLVGLEGDIAWGDGSKRLNYMQGIVLPGTGSFSEFRQHWDAGIRGRLGYLFAPNWLLYVTGGVQWQNVDATVSCAAITCGGLAFTQKNERTLVGWTIGGGIEAALWTNWLVRAEYRYAEFGSWTTSFGPPPVAVVKKFDVNTQTALVGLAYKF